MALALRRRQKGAALVEYGLLVAGVALVAAAAVSIFGTKTSDLFASVAAVLPGQNALINGPVESGRILEITDGTVPKKLAINQILSRSGTSRLSTNVGVDMTLLVIETN